jgi:DNA/RNA endonuclease YhcR with UshA esterase domain
MRRPIQTLVCLVVIVLAGLSVTASPCASPCSSTDDAKASEKVVPAAEAHGKVGQECTVEMVVKASKNAAGRRTYFLDSEEDFHDDKNFAVVISYDDAAKFQSAGIDDPAEHYKGKTIRVTGKVIHEDDQVRMRVDDPKQIKLVESK